MSVLFEDGDCIATSRTQQRPCIEFHVNEKERRGFHLSQLLHYALEPNSDEGKDAPPEKLSLAFATADVTLLGWRLDQVADKLRDGELVAVRTLPGRYADLDRKRPRISTITVEPISKA